jgi:uncharacterized protein (TIGR03067 family)
MTTAMVATLLALATPDDLEKLRGTWITVSQISDGKVNLDENAPAPSGPAIQLVYDGDQWAVKSGDKTFAKGTFKINSTKSPKEIDVMNDQGKVTLQGIYEVKENTYRYCVVPSGKPRPNDFTSKPGSGHILMVSKRDKP